MTQRRIYVYMYICTLRSSLFFAIWILGKPFAYTYFESLENLTAPPKTGKIMVHDGESLALARLLLDRGLVAPLRREELLFTGGRPLLNRLFGVSEGQLLGAEHGTWESRSMLRLIMNLTAANELLRCMKGDIALLPHFGMRKSLVLVGRETLVWTWEDLKGCFYLFRLPIRWAKVFAFDATSEVDEHAKRVVKERWPEVIELPPIR